MSGERMVPVTDEDVEFVRAAVDHYRLLAESAERQRQTLSSGLLRRQEFRAERFLARLEEGGGGS